MKLAAYFFALLLSAACVVLVAVLMLMANTNQRLQLQLQNQQQALNNGILGQQSQQIAGSVLQDMAGVAVRNAAMRKLLEQHGYHLPPGSASDASTNVMEKSQEAASASAKAREESSATANP